MSLVVNLGEVTYIVERERRAEAVEELWANLRAQERPGGGQFDSVVGVDEALVRAAAKVKAGGGTSYADSFAAAAAGILGYPVLTGDREFAILEAAGIVVHWLLSPVWPPGDSDLDRASSCSQVDGEGASTELCRNQQVVGLGRDLRRNDDPSLLVCWSARSESRRGLPGREPACDAEDTPRPVLGRRT
jgi:predicted nucleic acid-binding protein